jgi:hypothetical protein
MWPWKKRNRLAMVACVRNEAAWLPAFLHYHHAVGVEKAYLFCDRCSDASEAIARSFPWIQVFRLAPEQSEKIPYISDLHCACMDQARILARKDGFDWLLTIDPDEFASANNPASSAIGRAHLLPLLERLKPATIQVRLPTWEVVPMRLSADAPFWQHRYFQTTPRLTWTIVDPFLDRQHPWHDFVGHRQGKSIIRTDAAVQAYDSHRWVPDQGLRWPDRPEFVALPTEEVGCHLHFFVIGQRHWLEKFSKQCHEPDVWFCGKDIELPKRRWKQIVNGLPAHELEGYFDRWVARPEEELQRLAQQGVIVEDSMLTDVLRSTGALQEMLPFHPLGEPNQSVAVPFAWGWPAAKIPADQRRGFHGLERSGPHYFRWTEPHAAVQLQVPPGDYRLRLDMKQLSGLWAGRLELRLNDRPVPTRARQLRSGILAQTLCRQDFPAVDQRWLQFEFDPVNTTTWPHEQRRLGAPIFSIFLEPL